MSNLINSYAQACPTSKIVVMGYSQGAEVAGLALTGGVNGLQALSQKVHNQIVSVILWGDINRQGNQVYDRGSESMADAERPDVHVLTRLQRVTKTPACRAPGRRRRSSTRTQRRRCLSATCTTRCAAWAATS